MLLKTEIGGGIDGRSTYFTHEQHVDDQNSHQQNLAQREIYDVNNIITTSIPVAMSIFRDGVSDKHCDQYQPDNDFLRSGFCTQQDRLYKQ